MAAALALTVAGCGGGEDDGKKTESGSSSQPAGEKNTEGQDTAAAEQPDPNVKLAQLKGTGGVLLTVNEVKRESGGFVTVSGQIKNESSQKFTDRFPWKGNETEVSRASGNSVAGATLVDQAGKKRYYVLRDTDGQCLCTTGINPIEAGESIPVFWQFPAPPAETTEIDFNLPTFPVAKLKISG
ncbi:hypothetical protein [Streptomyces sp. NPDC056987]|uniref:hypothetical protein n=1 Tax=Streptomyces sp. NPDC056987 TaxID=3345988 RepID=UPI0036334400